MVAIFNKCCQFCRKAKRGSPSEGSQLSRGTCVKRPVLSVACQEAATWQRQGRHTPGHAWAQLWESQLSTCQLSSSLKMWGQTCSVSGKLLLKESTR